MDETAKVLLVDDDPIFAEATKIVLESKYKVIIAYDGDSGLRKAGEEKPDLILLDIIMPDKDGFHVCKQLKADAKLAKIPVIILTSFAQHKGETNIPVSDGFELEAEGYIDKPINPEALLKQVAAILERK